MQIFCQFYTFLLRHLPFNLTRWTQCLRTDLSSLNHGLNELGHSLLVSSGENILSHVLSCWHLQSSLGIIKLDSVTSETTWQHSHSSWHNCSSHHHPPLHCPQSAGGCPAQGCPAWSSYDVWASDLAWHPPSPPGSCWTPAGHSLTLKHSYVMYITIVWCHTSFIRENKKEGETDFGTK